MFYSRGSPRLWIWATKTNASGLPPIFLNSYLPGKCRTAGPVWIYWAFSMERFCGWLLPEIHSRCHPFSNIDNFVDAFARLSQIKIVYNLDEELSLHPKKAEGLRGSFSHPSCMCMSTSSCSTQSHFLTAIGFLDPRYVLLPPQHPWLTIPQPVENKIAIHFATCFSQNVNTDRQYLKQENITQWARVQQLAGGDLMYASELPVFNQAEDHRDATYVRVCMHFETSNFKLTQKYLSVWPTRRPQSTPTPCCSRMGGEALLWPAQTRLHRQVASCTWTGSRRRLLACWDDLLARFYPYMQCWQKKLTRNADLFKDGSIGGGIFGSTRVLGGEGAKWGVYNHYWSHRRVAGRGVCTRWLSSRFTTSTSAMFTPSINLFILQDDWVLNSPHLPLPRSHLQ